MLTRWGENLSKLLARKGKSLMALFNSVRRRALVLAFFVLPAAAHEIPHDVTITAHVRQVDEVLDVAVRVPLESMRDIDLPMRGPGYLIFGEALDVSLRDAAEIWIAGGLSVHADDRALDGPTITATRISLPSDRSFDSATTALAHLEGEAVTASDLLWNQALFDVHLSYDGVPRDAAIGLEPAWAHLGVRTTTRVSFTLPDGSIRRVRFVGDPGLVTADPGIGAVSWTFLELGARAIFERWDALLLVLSLLLVIRRPVPLIATAAALVAGLSIAILGLSVGVDRGPLWFATFVSSVIAIAVFGVGVVNLLELWRDAPEVTSARRRLMFGYASAGFVGYLGAGTLLNEMSFAGNHPAAAALGFVFGTALSVAFVALIVGALSMGLRTAQTHRLAATVASVLIAHTAWHWAVERFTVLAATHLVLPGFTTLLQWATLVLVAVGVYVGVVWLLERWVGETG